MVRIMEMINIWINDRRSREVWHKTVTGRLTVKKALKDAPGIILEKAMIFIAREQEFIDVQGNSKEQLLPGDHLNVVFLHTE